MMRASAALHAARILPKAATTRCAAARIVARRCVSSSSSVDADEIRRFAQSAAAWWDPHGEYGLLHRMNPVRVQYVRNALEKCSALMPDSTTAAPFAGLRMLDMGCGGGLLSESLARLGATVVGADATADNIAMAKAHAATDPSLARSGSIEYRTTTAEQLAQDGEQFDVVLALEIIEHVNDARSFVKTCTDLTRPGGYLFFSTINRTVASYLFTILLAEHVLKWVPAGTHTHAKYVAPEELDMDLHRAGCRTLDVSGLVYNPVSQKWSVSKSAWPEDSFAANPETDRSSSSTNACSRSRMLNQASTVVSAVSALSPIQWDLQMNYIMTARKMM